MRAIDLIGKLAIRTSPLPMKILWQGYSGFVEVEIEGAVVRLRLNDDNWQEYQGISPEEWNQMNEDFEQRRQLREHKKPIADPDGLFRNM